MGWLSAEQSPITSPAPIFLCIRGQPWLEALAFPSGGSTSPCERNKGHNVSCPGSQSSPSVHHIA